MQLGNESSPQPATLYLPVRSCVVCVKRSIIWIQHCVCVLVFGIKLVNFFPMKPATVRGKLESLTQLQMTNIFAHKQKTEIVVQQDELVI
jgi:hypothetical protein